MTKDGQVLASSTKRMLMDSPEAVNGEKSRSQSRYVDSENSSASSSSGFSANDVKNRNHVLRQSLKPSHDGGMGSIASDGNDVAVHEEEEDHFEEQLDTKIVDIGEKLASSRTATKKSRLTNADGQNHLSLSLNGLSSPLSVSTGSMSGRSSASSLGNVSQLSAKIGENLRPLVLTPRSSNFTSRKDVSRRKVSIREQPIVVTTPLNGASTLASVENQLNGTTPTLASTPVTLTSNRTSLIQVSERRARKVRFFINSDKFFKGAVIAVSGEKFRTFERLLEHLSRIMCNQVTLPNGVRFIFAFDGRAVDTVEELQHGGNYVCSSVSQFKKLDYLKMVHDQDHFHQSWKGMKRDTCFIGMGGGTVQGSGKTRRDAYKNFGHSKSFGLTRSGPAQANKDEQEPRFQIRPKIIAVLRCGLRPRKAVRFLINNRNTMSFDILLADLTATVHLDSGAVRKVFSLDGKPIVSVADFAESEVFIAYGVDKCSNEDFDLDMLEFRNVQSILKSLDLDAKYGKFVSTASPKLGKKKFLLSRNPTRRKRVSHSRNRNQNGAALNLTSSTGNQQQCGNSEQEMGVEEASLLSPISIDSFQDAPLEVSKKYVAGDVIGDGNFAVVRRCISKKTRQAFALKIIDKSKCLGKEHMIESEIAILSLASHPNIIELIEVFDFLNEKYLVTELVPGGDLFDAIAVDTKYSETVSRRMIADLASALQYLHDKMIVHRDIKPENLLVVKLDENQGSEAKKSLKLGDFGLAQLVSEPLYTVCGTPTYVAPEILAETGYGVKVDVWATGVIMYILLVGFPPFSSRTNNQEELFDQILSGLFEFNSPDWDDISYPVKELISLMLQVDPLQRYSAYEILQHPWILARR